MTDYRYIENDTGTVHLVDDTGLAICRSADVRGGKFVKPCADWNVCARCLVAANRAGIVKLYCSYQTSKVLAAVPNQGNWVQRAVAARWLDVLCNSLKSESDWLDAYKRMTEGALAIDVQLKDGDA